MTDENEEYTLEYIMKTGIEMGLLRDPADELPPEPAEWKEKKERKKPERVERRRKCKNFDEYTPIFAAALGIIMKGRCTSVDLPEGKLKVEPGEVFITGSQIAYVDGVEWGDDPRAFVIFDNGTQGALKVSSIKRMLYADNVFQRITKTLDFKLGLDEKGSKAVVYKK